MTTSNSCTSNQPVTRINQAITTDHSTKPSSSSRNTTTALFTIAQPTTKQELWIKLETRAPAVTGQMILLLVTYVFCSRLMPSFIPSISPSVLIPALITLTSIWTFLYYYRPFTRLLYQDFHGLGPELTFWGDLAQMNCVGTLPNYHRLLNEKYGKMSLTWIGTKPVIVISDPVLTQAIASKHHMLFPNRPKFPIGGGLLFERDAAWRAKKARLMPLFTNHALSFMQLERTAIESINRIKLAIEERGRRLQTSESNPWISLDFYLLMVEQQTHEIVEHCYDIKLSDPAIWSEFLPFDVTYSTPPFGTKIFHVDSHPYIQALDFISLHASAFNSGSQWLARMNLWPLPFLCLLHWRQLLTGNRAKDIMNQLGEFAERKNKGIVKREDLNSSNPSSSESSSTVVTFAQELSTMYEATSDLFNLWYLQSQLMEFVLGTAHTTSLMLTGTIYHITRESPEKQLQSRLQEEVASVLQMKSASELTMAEFLDDHPNSLLSSLPFLNACLLEAQRLYTPGGLTRENEQSIHLKYEDRQYFIPKMTEIQFTNVPHESEEYWYRPKEFLPERWLVTDDDVDSPHYPSHMKRLDPHSGTIFMPFGIGSRKCLGFNYAVAHMRLSLLLLIHQFEFRSSDKIDLTRTVVDHIEMKQGLVLVPKGPVMVEMRLQQPE